MCLPSSLSTISGNSFSFFLTCLVMLCGVIPFLLAKIQTSQENYTCIQLPKVMKVFPTCLSPGHDTFCEVS